MATILRITDGTTTCDLTDNTNYILEEGWVPNVARMRVNAAGGASDYEDVVENIPYSVMGATVADAYAANEVLIRLIDQAQRYIEGDDGVSPVRMQYQPNGSTLAEPLEALILGLADDAPATLNATYGDYNVTFPGLTLRFKRRGLLIAPTAESASSSSTTNPGVMTVTLPSSHNVWSPCRVELNDTLAASPNHVLFGTRDGFLVLAKSAGKIDLIQGEGFSGNSTSSVTSTADAARLASGGNVGRIQRLIGATTYHYVTKATTGNVGKRVGVFACYRNENSGYTGRMWAQLVPNNSLQYGYYPALSTPLLDIYADNTRPHVAYLGSIDVPYGYAGVHVYLYPTVNNAMVINLDWLCLVGLDDNTHITRLWNYPAGGNDITTYLMSAGAFTDVVDAAPLKREPFVGTEQSGNQYGLGYELDSYPRFNGDTVAGIILAGYATSSGTTDYYRVVQSGPSAQSFTLTVKRYKGYLSPQ